MTSNIQAAHKIKGSHAVTIISNLASRLPLGLEGPDFLSYLLFLDWNGMDLV